MTFLKAEFDRLAQILKIIKDGRTKAVLWEKPTTKERGNGRKANEFSTASGGNGTKRPVSEETEGPEEPSAL